MAQLRNAAQMYQQGSVKTASPAKLTLMLYEGAKNHCGASRYSGYEISGGKGV